jgi:hypothetical protein
MVLLLLLAFFICATQLSKSYSEISLQSNYALKAMNRPHAQLNLSFDARSSLEPEWHKNLQSVADIRDEKLVKNQVKDVKMDSNQIKEVQIDFFYSDGEPAADQDSASTARVLCDKDSSICSRGAQIKSHIRSRQRFTNPINHERGVQIHIRDEMFNFFGRPRWLAPAALDECPHKCTITGDSNNFDVSIALFNVPPNPSPDKVYAVLNVEPHSFENIPTGASNVVLMSFHTESELVVNYGYSVMHSFGLCIGDKPGTRDDGTKCENLRARDTPFYKWCSGTYGDFFTCVFHIVPHIAQMPWEQKSNDTLAVAWISQTCERHNGFLQRLMNLIKVDSMGGCHRNRDEKDHPGVKVTDHDSIWWGKDTPVPTQGSGVRKMLMAAHYKFYISLENTVIDDYVTEKFYEGFLTDSLMVYLGAPNARRYAPAPHSFIHALDFDGPESLAAHMLELAADPARYHAYFAWRAARPVQVTPAFALSMRHDMVRLDNRSMLCRLCGIAQPARPPAPAGA